MIRLLNGKYFCRTPGRSGMKRKPTGSSMNHASRSTSAYELEAKRKTRDEDIRRQFYRTILCIYSFIIQENSLALNVSAGYSMDNNVTLDTVQCAYTIHIYKSTFARSADTLRLLSLSHVLSFSHTLFRSLPLFRSLYSLSATKVGTVFFAVSRIIVSYLNNKFKLAVTSSG